MKPKFSVGDILYRDLTQVKYYTEVSFHTREVIATKDNYYILVSQNGESYALPMDIVELMYIHLKDISKLEKLIFKLGEV